MVQYIYEIKTFADNDRKIEIIYTMNDGQTRHVESKLPKDGESIEDLVRSYEPLAFWDVPEIQPVWPESDKKNVAPAQQLNSIPVSEL